MSTADTVLVVTKGIGEDGAVSIVNTFHYLMDDGSGVPDLPTFLDNFDLVVLQPITAIMSEEYTCISIVATVVFGPSLGQQAELVGPPHGAGLLAGNPAPYTSCLVLTRSAGVAFRAGKGRVFISPVLDSVFADDGKLNTLPAAINGAVDAMRAVPVDASANAYRSCLFHSDPPAQLVISKSGVSGRMGIRKHRRWR